MATMPVSRITHDRDMQQLDAIGVRNLGTGVRTLGRLTSWRKYSLAEILLGGNNMSNDEACEPATC